jgi:hypothetical protein
VPPTMILVAACRSGILGRSGRRARCYSLPGSPPSTGCPVLVDPVKIGLARAGPRLVWLGLPVSSGA